MVCSTIGMRFTQASYFTAIEFPNIETSRYLPEKGAATAKFGPHLAKNIIIVHDAFCPPPSLVIYLFG